MAGGKTAALLGIGLVSADTSATTGVMKVQAAKEDRKGQAQAAERAEEAHSGGDFGSVAEVVKTMRTHTGQAVREQ